MYGFGSWTRHRDREGRLLMTIINDPNNEYGIGAPKGCVIEIDGCISDEGLEEFKEAWEARFKGLEHAEWVEIIDDAGRTD